MGDGLELLWSDGAVTVRFHGEADLARLQGWKERLLAEASGARALHLDGGPVTACDAPFLQFLTALHAWARAGGKPLTEDPGPAVAAARAALGWPASVVATEGSAP